LIDQNEAEELGALAQRLEFTSTVKLVVSSCTGVVIDEIAGQDAVDQHRELAGCSGNCLGLAHAGGQAAEEGAERLRQAAFFPRTLLRKMSAGSQMDMPTARTENLKRFSRSAAAVGILRVHGRARIAPHAPISSLLHNVGKHARLCGGGREV